MDRRILGALGAAAITLAACGGTATPGPSASAGAAAPKADVKGGLGISLTGVGNVYGPTQRHGVPLAAERINPAGGGNGAQIAPGTSDAPPPTHGPPTT